MEYFKMSDKIAARFLLTIWCLITSWYGSTCAFTGVSDNCYLTMIVPRDKIKNTCLAEENLRKRIRSLENRITQFRDRVTQQEIRLINQYDSQEKSFQKVNQNIQLLSDDIKKVEQKKVRLPNFYQSILSMGRSGGGIKSQNDDGNLNSRSRFSTIDMPKEQTTKTTNDKNVNMYGTAFEMLKPYVDEQIQLIKKDLNKRIDKEVKPVTAAFETVENAATKSESEYADKFKETWMEGKTDPIQVRTNTLALSKVLPEMTQIQEVLFDLADKQTAVKIKMAELEQDTLVALAKVTSQKKELEVRIAELEGENRLLKINETFENRFTRFRSDMVKELMKVTNEQLDEYYRSSIERTGLTNKIPTEVDYKKSFDIYLKNFIPNGNSKLVESLTNNVTTIMKCVNTNSKFIDSLSGEIKEFEIRIKALNDNLISYKYEPAGAVNNLTSYIKTIEEQMTTYDQRLSRVGEDLHNVRDSSITTKKTLADVVKILNTTNINNYAQNRQLKSMSEHFTNQQNNLKKLRKTHADDTVRWSTLIGKCCLSKEKLTVIDISLRKTMSASHLTLSNKIDVVRRVGASGRFELQAKIVKLSSSTLARYKILSRSIESVVDRFKKSNDTMHNQQIVTARNIFITKSKLESEIDDVKSRLLIYDLQRKLNSKNWIEYNFTSIEGHNECNGKRYVRRTKENYSRLLIGIVLCSPKRYKIFLASQIDDLFLDVGDDQGFGGVHCALIGGKSKQRPIGVDENMPVFLTPTEGYLMTHRNNTPRKTTLSFIVSSPPWYECGVVVP